jgi:DNA polymerase-3 subunit epsilon
MKRFEQQTFICMDCETTGLDVDKDRIIEIAITKFTFNEILEEFETLVNPEKPIPEESIKIHHITDEMVQHAPLMKDVLPRALEMIGNHIIVGHGVKFDVDMVRKAAERVGVPTKIAHNPMLDTLRMARLYGESPINSLEQLRKHFNIEEEGAHRAMSDVIVNMNVFKQLCKNHKSLDHLFEVLSRPIPMKIMPLGNLRWAANKDFDQDLLFSLRSEIKRRKSGNHFTQSANPFHGL